MLHLPFPHKVTIPVYGPRRHGAWPRGEEYPQARETCYPIPMPLPDQTHSLLFVFQSPSPMPCSVLMMLCLNILLLTFFALLFCCFTSSSAAQWDHIKLRHPGCVPPPPPRGLTPSCMQWLIHILPCLCYITNPNSQANPRLEEGLDHVFSTGKI